MGSINYNCLRFDSFCPGDNNELKTQTHFQKYEDKHVKVEAKYSVEKCNGRTRNEDRSVSIYNKDDYYKPKELLGSGNHLFLGN